MNSLKNKIKSRAGASITFALLLFLVCAIISSIVIVAATASSGRMAKQAETDQRYYAVSSAAELLRDVFEKQTVVVTTGTQSVSTVNQNRETVSSDPATDIPMAVSISDGEEEYDVSDDANPPLLANAAELLADPEEAFAVIRFDPLELQIPLNDGKHNVKVMGTLTSDGTLVFDLFRGTGNKNSGNVGYTLRLTFDMDRTDTTNTKRTNGVKTPVPGKLNEYTMPVTTTVTNRSVFRWKLRDIKVASQDS